MKAQSRRRRPRWEIAVKDFFQNDDEDEEDDDEEVETEDEDDAEGRSLRDDEGLSLGLWRAWSTDGEGSGREERRRREGSRERAWWSVTMSRARAASPASAARSAAGGGWRRDDMGRRCCLGLGGDFLGEDGAAGRRQGSGCLALVCWRCWFLSFV